MNKKNIVKLSLFTLILAFIAIGTIAVAKVMNKEKPVEVTDKAVVMEIWEFTGADDPEENNPLDPLQYSKSENPSCDNETETVCSLSAPANPTVLSQPDLEHTVPGIPGPNNKVSDRIQQALNSGTPNETVLAFRSE